MLKCKIINMAILAWQKLTMLNKEYMREYKVSSLLCYIRIHVPRGVSEIT